MEQNSVNKRKDNGKGIKLRPLLLLTLCLIGSSCAREFMNPYDPATPPNSWMPSELTIDTLGRHALRLRWQQDELHIDGYTVRRDVSGEIREFILPFDSLMLTDLNIIDSTASDTCLEVTYSVMARAGENLSSAIGAPLILPLTASSYAGTDIIVTSPTTSTVLSASKPQNGERGEWKIVSGTGGVIADPTESTTAFSGQPCATYTLRWTIEGCGGEVSDDVFISFIQGTTQSNAGQDITVAFADSAASFGYSVNLNANPPDVLKGETGWWSIVSGEGGSFGNSTMFNTSFTGVGGTYVLRWQITGVCSSNADTVLVSIPTPIYLPGAGVYFDGYTYRTINVNGQEWMAENLRTTRYANGDTIPNVTGDNQWANLTTGAWTHQGNISENENPYGKLYNWYTVADPRNVCPAGWHVPSQYEWRDLISFLSAGPGGKMKSAGTQYWSSPNTNATNESGFSGLPGGNRYDNGNFFSIGQSGYYWSSSMYGGLDAKYLVLEYDSDTALVDWNLRGNGMSVRCVKD